MVYKADPNTYIIGFRVSVCLCTQTCLLWSPLSTYTGGAITRGIRRCVLSLLVCVPLRTPEVRPLPPHLVYGELSVTRAKRIDGNENPLGYSCTLKPQDSREGEEIGSWGFALFCNFLFFIECVTRIYSYRLTDHTCNYFPLCPIADQRPTHSSKSGVNEFPFLPKHWDGYEQCTQATVLAKGSSVSEHAFSTL